VSGIVFALVCVVMTAGTPTPRGMLGGMLGGMLAAVKASLASLRAWRRRRRGGGGGGGGPVVAGEV
jgi:hypothetical protein